MHVTHLAFNGRNCWCDICNGKCLSCWCACWWNGRIIWMTSHKYQMLQGVMKLDDMKTPCALMTHCLGKSSVIIGFPTQRVSTYRNTCYILKCNRSDCWYNLWNGKYHVGVCVGVKKTDRINNVTYVQWSMMTSCYENTLRITEPLFGENLCDRRIPHTMVHTVRYVM